MLKNSGNILKDKNITLVAFKKCTLFKLVHSNRTSREIIVLSIQYKLLVFDTADSTDSTAIHAHVDILHIM